MDPLPATVIRPAGPPLICAQGDDIWHLELAAEGVAIVLSTVQVGRVVDDFLEQQLGGPFEDPES